MPPVLIELGILILVAILVLIIGNKLWFSLGVAFTKIFTFNKFLSRKENEKQKAFYTQLGLFIIILAITAVFIVVNNNIL